MTKDRQKKPREQPPMTMQEAGRKGGQRVSEKYGHTFFTDIGKKGGRALAAKRDSTYFAEIGRKGGETTLRRHGTAYYAQIGAKADAPAHPEDVPMAEDEPP